MIKTTFKACREADACLSSYRKAGKHVGGIKKHGERKEVPVLRVLDVLGLEDALWVLANACGEEGRKLLRLWCCDTAARVLNNFERKYPNDERPRDAIKASRAYARGQITIEDLSAAFRAAFRAAASAGDSAAFRAGDSAAFSAGDSVGDSVGDSAVYRAAASAVYRAAASAVYRAAASAGDSAAFRAEREWQTERLRAYLSADKLPRAYPLPKKPKVSS